MNNGCVGHGRFWGDTSADGRVKDALPLYPLGIQGRSVSVVMVD